MKSQPTSQQKILSMRTWIHDLYQRNADIQVTMHTIRPKSDWDKIPAKIVGVYPHFFQITQQTKGISSIHTITYTDLCIQNIQIEAITKN
ncbi:MAG: hypothetical protein IJW96_02795 [Clostridia bacterium]|nr:hypothetical protein [Clostridia bacterium]